MKVTRRQFLGLFLAGLATTIVDRFHVRGAGTFAQGIHDGLDMPMDPLRPFAAPGDRPKVVHCHYPGACSWNFSSGWYGDYVDQNAVNTMMDLGIQHASGHSGSLAAWLALFSRVNSGGYQAGQKIAIKVNLNNARSCDDSDNSIDALPQLLIALIRSLVSAGVAQQDIWIYDATYAGKTIPERFRQPIASAYPQVLFFGNPECSGVQPVVYSQSDQSLRLVFQDPGGHLSDRWLPDLLGQASYLINMPILKYHGISPVTLGFKNHFGSINNVMRAGSDNLHEFISPGSSLYEDDYSPLIDIYSNVNIYQKTVLTIGDGLYGARNGATTVPAPWNSFGNAAPQSLFFGVDPVAVDCVMADIVSAEQGVLGNSTYDYLCTAEAVNLGICEGTRSNPGGDPWQMPYGAGYVDIDYQRLALPLELEPRIYFPMIMN